MNVIYTDANSNRYGVVSNQTGGNCDIGWRYTDTSGTKLELCGDTCAYIRHDPFGKLSILLACGGPPVLW